jgi:hypothetical protein|tara:strand:+ start:177 stop:977 length:801 start_codon:yes stop_codon:yes gene_type:complete
MKMEENWHVHAPWAQLVCCTEIPEDKLIKLMAISNETLDEAKSAEDNFEGGIIPQPWSIIYDKWEKYGVLNYIMEMTEKYMQTILWNGNVQSNLNTTIPGGPHTFWNARIAGGWVVSQKENDYIPVHTHNNQTESCKISAVLYLKVPEQLERPSNEMKIRGGQDGQIVFTGVGGADLFSTTSHFNIPPQQGWLYLFPSSLTHQVYPFKGEGERRGISLNIDVISKEQLQVMEENLKVQREGMTYNDYKIDTEEDAKANSMGYEVKL